MPLDRIKKVSEDINRLVAEREALITQALEAGHSGAAICRAAGWSRTTLDMRRTRGLSNPPKFYSKSR